MIKQMIKCKLGKFHLIWQGGGGNEMKWNEMKYEMKYNFISLR